MMDVFSVIYHIWLWQLSHGKDSVKIEIVPIIYYLT